MQGVAVPAATVVGTAAAVASVMCARPGREPARPRTRPELHRNADDSGYIAAVAEPQEPEPEPEIAWPPLDFSTIAAARTNATLPNASWSCFQLHAQLLATEQMQMPAALDCLNSPSRKSASSPTAEAHDAALGNIATEEAACSSTRLCEDKLLTPKAYIIHDNAIWIKDLKSALEADGTPYLCTELDSATFVCFVDCTTADYRWLIGDPVVAGSCRYGEWVVDEGGVNGLALDLSAPPPPGIFFNRVSPSSHTRGKRYACEFTLGLLHWLSEYGCRVINGENTHEHSVSKVAGYAALRRCGVRVPRTLAAVGRAQLLAAAHTFEGRRFMAKHNRGGSGSGVVLFDTITQFEQYLHSEDFQPAVDGITVGGN